MRLFRRFLLCLVVGVTAFGAAGWGFRPRASWELSLGAAGSSIQFDDERHDGCAWIVREGSDDADTPGYRRSALMRVDVRDHAIERNIPIPKTVGPWPRFR